MCACVPGSTCNYHNYKFWSREKKDGFNARRRAAYHAKVSQQKRSIPQTFEMSELSPEEAAQTQKLIDGVNYPQINQKIISESVMRSQELPFERPTSSKFKDGIYEGFNSYDSHLIREWTGNNGSTTENSEIAEDLLSLIADREDPSRDKRTLYRRINLPWEIRSQEEIMDWVSEHYPIDSEKALSTGGGPVSATTDFSFASNGNMPGIVFRTQSSRGMDHPDYDYESEVMMLPDTYKVDSYTWMDDKTLLIDVIEDRGSEETVEETAVISKLPKTMGAPIIKPIPVIKPIKVHPDSKPPVISPQNQFANLMNGGGSSSEKPQTVAGSPNWVEPGSDPRTDESILYERRATRERMSKLSERQKEILDEYKSHEHDRFNSPLSKNPATPAERAELKAIVSELEKGNESRNLWRGESPKLGTTINDLLERFPEGEKISWGERFVSTSSSPKMAERFTGSIGGTEGILIKFEETVKGAAIFHGDKNDGELETLMSGDNEFMVKSKRQEMVYGSPHWVVTLTDA